LKWKSWKQKKWTKNEKWKLKIWCIKNHVWKSFVRCHFVCIYTYLHIAKNEQRRRNLLKYLFRKKDLHKMKIISSKRKTSPPFLLPKRITKDHRQLGWRLGPWSGYLNWMSYMHRNGYMWPVNGADPFVQKTVRNNLQENVQVFFSLLLLLLLIFSRKKENILKFFFLSFSFLICKSADES
jgi:hypothetical protein